jgi:hypothetical protein
MSIRAPGVRRINEPQPTTTEVNVMAHVHAVITMSVDGYITGPDDRAGQGLGKGGPRSSRTPASSRSSTA